MNHNRNRHTGHVNAFKAAIIKRGKKFLHAGKTYYRAYVGKGYTIVRIK